MFEPLHTDNTSNLMELLIESWDTCEQDPRLPKTEPIAKSSEDQKSTTDNPFWDIIRWLPSVRDGYKPKLSPDFLPTSWGKEQLKKFIDAGLGRSSLSKTYAWSIPTPGDLTWITQILDGRAVVEVGAGTGYWAWQLEQCGIDVAAYDPNPVDEDNRYCSGGPYTTVLRQDASAAAHHPDRALLLVWPPYDDPAAAHALASYSGDLLIYAGEGDGGCTGDDTFHELLGREWEEIGYSADHVTWWGIHCNLVAYRRKP
ncbi:hypothetical protein [Rhodococcus qingshengii]|uniref:hypothetical protein n=1 Tax=Rhodococcus qingshengii TaxID=334542 RepID=UPI0035DAB2C6